MNRREEAHKGTSQEHNFMSDSQVMDPFSTRHSLLPLRLANRAWSQAQRGPCEEDLKQADRSENCKNMYVFTKEDPPGKIQAQLLCQILKQKFKNPSSSILNKNPYPSIRLGIFLV